MQKQHRPTFFFRTQNMSNFSQNVKKVSLIVCIRLLLPCTTVTATVGIPVQARDRMDSWSCAIQWTAVWLWRQKMQISAQHPCVCSNI